MNKEEKIEKVRHMKNYFFISFWISFTLLIVATLMCIIMYDAQTAFAATYFSVSPEFGLPCDCCDCYITSKN